MKSELMSIKFYKNIFSGEISGKCETAEIFETPEIISCIIKLKQLIEKQVKENK